MRAILMLSTLAACTVNTHAPHGTAETSQPAPRSQQATSDLGPPFRIPAAARRMLVSPVAASTIRGATAYYDGPEHGTGARITRMPECVELPSGVEVVTFDSPELRATFDTDATWDAALCDATTRPR
jgi:hypothetical protein